ncbi:unnamed protein product [Lactuca saligna]|uniref:Uncharacterized protein n=1 Tax=Lactuca saligna TaxID=75948 RepID=A0AA35YT46_LACSI|nr:unnamed protein product [Lactuca saligna]
MVEQNSIDLHWLLRKRISIFVRALLSLEDFGNINASVQITYIRLGLLQDFKKMKDNYFDELSKKGLLYSYLDIEDILLKCFCELLNNGYSLLLMTDAEAINMGSLKKHIEDICPPDNGVEHGRSSK